MQMTIPVAGKSQQKVSHAIFLSLSVSRCLCRLVQTNDKKEHIHSEVKASKMRNVECSLFLVTAALAACTYNKNNNDNILRQKP